MSFLLRNNILSHENVFIIPNNSGIINLDPLINQIQYIRALNDIELKIIDIYDKHPELIDIYKYNQFIQFKLFIISDNNIILTFDPQICFPYDILPGSINLNPNYLNMYTIFSFDSALTWCLIFSGSILLNDTLKEKLFI